MDSSFETRINYAVLQKFSVSNFHNILEANIPNSKKVILPGVGHMSNMENPGNFNKEVLNFIKEH